MSMAYNPSSVAFEKTLYVVETTGDQFFIPTTGRGDNPDSGTMAQRLAQCQLLSPDGEETVA